MLAKLSIPLVISVVAAASALAQAPSASQPSMSPTEAPQGMSARPAPQMQKVLDELQQLGAKPLAKLSVGQAREQPSPADAVKAVLKEEGKSTAPEKVAKVEDRQLQVQGGTVPMRVYWPAGGSGTLEPVILYIHGGGWVIADLDTYDASARALANAANAIVVSTHYRQAPEHPFPAAHEDTWAAYQWTRKNARSLGGNAGKIAVAGESAGGNMAASIAMRAKREGVPLPVHQLLVYPVAQVGTQTESYRENESAKPLDAAAMKWFGDKYLTEPGDGNDPRIALLSAKDYSGLPPATIITAEIDPLRSEGRMLAEKLQQAGVEVDYRNFDGVTHEFFGMAAVVPDARQAVQLAGKNLRMAFGSGGASKRAAASEESAPTR